MTYRERWQEIDRVFIAALECEPAARAAFLDEACAGDELLRQEVESLLANDLPESLVGDQAIQEATRLLDRNAENLIPERIGRYRIIKSLGAGGMGRVYLGLDEKLNRQVAVKLLSNYDAGEEERMRRFRQEALAASALNHPNILTIYEIGEFAGANFIIAEFVDGVTLRARIMADVLSIDLALDIAIQIASALSAAHAAGIIHRDIKSENVMVRSDGLVKVLDFGIAKFTQADGEEKKDLVKTMTGAIIGTATYMSPEQARGTLVDTRSDIWSLGVILYEMVARRLPFWGETAADVIAAILERQPPPLPTDDSVALQSWERIVFKALQKEKENRYQTAAELSTDLKQLRQTPGVVGIPERLDSQQAQGGSDDQSLEAKNVSALAVLASGEREPTGSSAEYIVGRIKHYKYAVLAVLVTFILVTAAFLIYRSRVPNSGSRIESIAVLPFANAAQDPNAEYLSDGITESLINRLSQLSNLKVMSSSSVFRYKGREQEAQKVGNELKVRAVLTGSVKQIGDQLVINVSLDDAQDNHRIWGDQYVRKFADVLTVQNEIAQEVSSNLRMKLTGAEQQQLAKRYTENVEAYQLYLKGMYEWKKHTQEDLQKGIDFLNQAIEKDPNYALAYSGLSGSYGVLGNNYLPPNEAFPKSKAYAAKALAIDDTLPEAHTAMGGVRLYYDWDFAEAQKECKRAQSLDPNNAVAHHLYADSLEIMGRFDGAKAERKRALELDPLPPMYTMADGATLYFAGQDDEAVAQLEKTINLEPRFVLAYLYLGEAYEQKKMYAEALATYQKGMTQAERHPQLIAALGHACALSGERDKALKALAELRETSKQRYVSPYLIAIVYLGLGDKDQTFAWLDKAYQDRSSFLIWLKVEPLFDSLRDDPRFQDLLRRVGLTR